MDLKMIVMVLTLGCVQGQFFEDRRCRCVCPNPASLLNTTNTRQIFTSNVPPSLCHCEGVVFPMLKAELEGKLHMFCPRCECTYQTRNTSLIMSCSIIHDTTSPWQAARSSIEHPIRVRHEFDVVSCAIVFFILIGIVVSLLYMASFAWLKNLLMRGRNDLHVDRHLERPAERDYIREYRGEFQRERDRQRLRELELERLRELELERRLEQLRRERERAQNRYRNYDDSSDSEEVLLLEHEEAEN